MRELRIKLGSCASKDFKMFLGDEDITNRLSVKSLHLSVSGDNPVTTVTMEVYPEELDIIAGIANVRILQSERPKRNLFQVCREWFSRRFED